VREEIKQTNDVLLKDVLILIRKHYSSSLSYLGLSMEAVYFVLVWPVFLLVTFGRIVDLGIIVSAAALIASIASIVIGKDVDRKGGVGILGLGSIFLSLSWFVRLFWSGMGFFIIAEGVANFGGRMQAVSFNQLTYKKAKETGDASSAILFREVSLIFGGLILVGVMLLWLVTIKDLRYSFLIPAIGSITPFLYVFHKFKTNKRVHNG
jgi:hypothetical protein